MNVVSFSELEPNWNWLAHRFTAHSTLRWAHVSTQTSKLPRRLPRRHTWQRLAAAWNCRALLQPGDSVLVSHGPKMTMYAALANAGRVNRSPHLAFSFNYTRLPDGPSRRLQRYAFRFVDRFVVSSTMEQSLYADYFGIEPRRIEMIHWAVRPPEMSAAEPALVLGDYICAVGSQGRDYGVLVEAMKSLPRVKLVIVATAEAMRGIERIPANVEVRSNIPLREATNIIGHSKCMVLPLLGQHVPCGHVTIVAAMHLSKAIVATASSGIADYVHDGVNGRLAAASDHARLAALIAELVESPDDCRRLGEAGQRFAQRHCSEDNAVAFFLRVLPTLIAGRHYRPPAETLSPSTGFGL